MLVNSQFKKLIKEKYTEAKKLNQEEIILDEKKLGGLTLYINKEPSSVLITLKKEDFDPSAEENESAKDVVYIGGTLLETA